MATIVFGQITAQEIFFICGGVSIAGIIFTILFSCDLTRVSLAEHDVSFSIIFFAYEYVLLKSIATFIFNIHFQAQLELLLEGHLREYKGMLNEPKHCSLFERLTRRHGDYEPEWAVDMLKSEKVKFNKEMAVPLLSLSTEQKIGEPAAAT